MKKFLLFAFLIWANSVFATNVDTQENTNQPQKTETLSEFQNLPQVTTPSTQDIEEKSRWKKWKERKALKVLNKRIEKAKKTHAEAGSIVYTVGLIIVVLGLVGLVLGGTLGTIGVSGIILGLVLVLVGKLLL